MRMKKQASLNTSMAPEYSWFHLRRYDTKMNKIVSSDQQDLFASYDEGLWQFWLDGVAGEPYVYGLRSFCNSGRRFVPFCKDFGAIQQGAVQNWKATLSSAIMQQLDYNLFIARLWFWQSTRELVHWIWKGDAGVMAIVLEIKFMLILVGRVFMRLAYSSSRRSCCWYSQSCVWHVADAISLLLLHQDFCIGWGWWNAFTWFQGSALSFCLGPSSCLLGCNERWEM